MFYGICSESTGGEDASAVVWFQQKCIVAALLESCFCVECSPVDLLHVFGAPYYGMVSEGLFSLHHRLQIHCIVNANTCRKRPDDKTIVFCRSLQILTQLEQKSMQNFCKREKGKKISCIQMQTICMDGKCLKNFLQEVLNE